MRHLIIAAKIVGAGLVIAFSIFLFFRFFALNTYPDEWKSSLLGESRMEIERKIGPPNEDVSAKDYLLWSRDYWWGWKQFIVAGNGISAKKAKPDSIVYESIIGARHGREHFNFIVKAVYVDPLTTREDIDFQPKQLGSYLLSFLFP